MFEWKTRILKHLSELGQAELARDYRQCLKGLLLGCGGGLIVAITVLLKTLIVHSGHDGDSAFGPWLATTLSALNYVLCFLAMQALGFKLATKQAPMLGVALARLKDELEAILSLPQELLKKLQIGALTHQAVSHAASMMDRLGPLNPLLATKLWRNQLVWALRTQLSSAFGNFIFVIPASVALQKIYEVKTGLPLLDPVTAREILTSLDPVRSGTMLYAAMTGAILWHCTYLGGMIAHRLGWPSKRAAGIAFNTLLGILLAVLPAAGAALGLDLDVRHFTLSGGFIAVSTASLGVTAALQGGLLAAAYGLVIIGVMNFGVSSVLGYLATRLHPGLIPPEKT